MMFRALIVFGIGLAMGLAAGLNVTISECERLGYFHAGDNAKYECKKRQ